MTYSIVARDPVTGAIGVGVQSHYFGVGPLVPWALAGTGAVATQSFANIHFGPDALSRLATGTPAADVVAEMIASDSEAEIRQLAVVDAAGAAAAHTGTRCVRHAGHFVGEGYSVQGNFLHNPRVWPAMASAFEGSAALQFWERLLAALDAGEAAGGDIRGRQSAALLVVSSTVPTTAPWEHRLFDVRVDDHAEPLAELRRLARTQQAYRLMGQTRRLMDDGRPLQQRYAEARRLAPTAIELVFWYAVELAVTGDEATAKREMQVAIQADPTWREVLDRVSEAGFVGDDPGLVARLLDGIPT